MLPILLLYPPSAKLSPDGLFLLAARHSKRACSALACCVGFGPCRLGRWCQASVVEHSLRPAASVRCGGRKAVWETVSVALPGGAPQQPPQTPIWFIPLTPREITPGKTVYVQASYIISEESTRQREFGPMEKIRDNHPKYVISVTPLLTERDENGIKHLSLRKFLKEGI